jgi:mono/diheme cytochrome c family protein
MQDIVVNGLFRQAGMPSFPNLSEDDVEAIRAYLINQAWARYEQH